MSDIIGLPLTKLNNKVFKLKIIKTLIVQYHKPNSITASHPVLKWSTTFFESRTKETLYSRKS